MLPTVEQRRYWARKSWHCFDTTKHASEISVKFQFFLLCDIMLRFLRQLRQVLQMEDLSLLSTVKRLSVCMQ